MPSLGFDSEHNLTAQPKSRDIAELPKDNLLVYLAFLLNIEEKINKKIIAKKEEKKWEVKRQKDF